MWSGSLPALCPALHPGIMTARCASCLGCPTPSLHVVCCVHVRPGVPASGSSTKDFNPKAERARAMRGTGGSGGVATARVKSKGPSGTRAAAAAPWPSSAAARPGSNRAAAAQKAAHRAAQNAAQRMHPHAHVGPHMGGHVGPPQRAGGGHMSAVVPAHRCDCRARALAAAASTVLPLHFCKPSGSCRLSLALCCSSWRFVLSGFLCVGRLSAARIDVSACFCLVCVSSCTYPGPGSPSCQWAAVPWALQAAPAAQCWERTWTASCRLAQTWQQRLRRAQQRRTWAQQSAWTLRQRAATQQQRLWRRRRPRPSRLGAVAGAARARTTSAGLWTQSCRSCTPR